MKAPSDWPALPLTLNLIMPSLVGLGPKGVASSPTTLATSLERMVHMLRLRLLIQHDTSTEEPVLDRCLMASANVFTGDGVPWSEAS